jgi:hypothetical protein
LWDRKGQGSEENGRKEMIFEIWAKGIIESIRAAICVQLPASR